ncbi:hypothetical protein ACFO4E_02340 [Nocardiopsis mangrovi]|uniref:DUF2092 domain-containing protein n=1 Tax=Nocardiopsis mangrovi TaxID=1179818 RepID=A0ABV9DPV0_9ACTN
MKRLLPHSALCLTAVLLVTACQGDGGSGESGAEPTPTPVPAGEMDATELPEDPEALADLVEDRMREALTVTVGVTVEPEEPASDDPPLEDTQMTLLLTDPPAARMTVVENTEERQSTTTMIVVDRVIYAQLEEEPLVEGKDWLRLSRDEVDAAEERIGPFAEIFRILLTETNAALDEASGDAALDVVRLGEPGGDPATERTDDGEVTRYEGTTATADLADAGNDDFADMAELGLEEIGWEISVTDRGLPTEYALHLLAPDGEEPVVSTVRYSDWGADAEITAPPEDTVGTIDESMGG